VIAILYEDNHLIAINKPSGILVQGDSTGDMPMVEIVKDFIKKRDQKPGNVFLGVIHRIDRPTSGIILFAKTSKALSRMNKLFADKKVKKTYWAVVEGIVDKEEQRLVHYLSRNHKLNKSFVTDSNSDKAKKAVLYYQVLHRLKTYSLLKVKIETGRHHQIRVQLSHIQYPIKGDLKYNSKRSNSDKSISLLAKTLAFTHPVSGKEIEIEADLPHTDIWKIIRQDLAAQL
jgi:23S rRNA pseudouridine1911/1915/1917 synthase